MSDQFSVKLRIPRKLKGSLKFRKHDTWERRLYFPSEGRLAEDFFVPKNSTATTGYETANVGTSSRHANH
jgi:hypothetical protein